jgi:hypothetical protein
MLESFLDSIEAPFSDDDEFNFSSHRAEVFPPQNHVPLCVRAVVVARTPLSCVFSHLRAQSVVSFSFSKGSGFMCENIGYIALDDDVNLDIQRFFSGYSLVVVLHACRGTHGCVRYISSGEFPGNKRMKHIESPIDGMPADILTKSIIRNDAACIVLVNQHQSFRCEADGIISLWQALNEIILVSDNLEIPNMIRNEFRKIVPLHARVPLYS